MFVSHPKAAAGPDPPHGIWGGLPGTAGARCGCRARVDSCQLSPRHHQKGQACTFHLGTHPPSPSASPSIRPATRPANSAN